MRHLALTAEAGKRFLGDSLDYVNKKQARLMLGWCNNVPVLGLNSGRYDLNLIKEHFISSLAEIKNNKINLAKNGNKIMFLRTKRLRFLDVMNYVGPGTSYDKWVKGYDCEQEKSWFPYEWFDSPEKLDFPGLPPYECWFSKLKNEYFI